MPKLSREGQMVFETILQMHEEGNEDLNKKDDGMRCAYRAGLRGGTPLLDRRTREYAAWLAGRKQDAVELAKAMPRMLGISARSAPSECAMSDGNCSSLWAEPGSKASSTKRWG